MNRMTTTAVAALVAMPLALTGPAIAQNANSTATQSGNTQTNATGMDRAEDQQIVVMVGDTEITTGDVARAIAALPQQMQQQPAEQLVPFAVDQLILRELILQDAAAKGITGDRPAGSSDSTDMSSDANSDASATVSTETAETDTSPNADDDSTQMAGTDSASTSDSVSSDDTAGNDMADGSSSSSDTMSSDTSTSSEMASDSSSSDATSAEGSSSSEMASETAPSSSEGTGDAEMTAQGSSGATDSMPNTQSQDAQDTATIQAYLGREMEGVVTDEAVQEAYDEVASNATTDVPPLEAVRPQIEQQLRQQALNDLRNDLGDNVEIVFYGPDGQPREVSTDDG